MVIPSGGLYINSNSLIYLFLKTMPKASPGADKYYTNVTFNFVYFLVKEQKLKEKQNKQKCLKFKGEATR